MHIRKLTDDFSVSDQLSPADVYNITNTGYRTIICNRPDGEDDQQPPLDVLENAAEISGISIMYVPVVHDKISATDVAAFNNAWHEADKPVLAYCRSGLRSSTLWALMQIANGMPLPIVLASVSAAGFDFSDFSSKFGQILAEITDGQ